MNFSRIARFKLLAFLFVLTSSSVSWAGVCVSNGFNPTYGGPVCSSFTSADFCRSVSFCTWIGA